jgi:hypothetical protein
MNKNQSGQSHSVPPSAPWAEPHRKAGNEMARGFAPARATGLDHLFDRAAPSMKLGTDNKAEDTPSFNPPIRQTNGV